jgi:tetratricopeptide (TPR) repeat protein
LLVSSASAQPPKLPTEEQKAREAFQAGRLDEALKLLEAAAKANPQMAPPKVVLSRWLLEANQGPSARAVLERAAAEDPDHPDVLLTNAAYALREGRFTDAILSYQAALNASNSPRWDADTRRRFQREARLGLVAAYDARGDLGSAKVHLQALIEADPRNPLLRVQMGRANFLLNRPEDAFAEFQVAFREDPTLDPPELAMAQLWAAKGDTTKADEWFAKAVAAHGNSAKVHREFAGYLLSRDRLDPARAHLTAAQKIDPKNPDTRLAAGVLARYERNFPAATAIFEELVREYPASAPAAANLALVLAESPDVNQRRRAIDLAQVAVNLNPRNPNAFAALGYCLYKDGRLTDAEKAMVLARNLGPVGPDSAYFIARVMATKGDVEGAHKAVSLALESKDLFLYRKEAEALRNELAAKLPKK